jgi:hypothetical protein
MRLPWERIRVARESRATSRTHVYRLAAVASVLGFPLMLVDAVRRGHPLAPNQFLRLPMLSGALAPGLRDDERRTTRHSAWIDVSQAPVVITLKGLQDSHFSLLAVDAWGDCIASVSPRNRPGSRQELAIVGRDWTGKLMARGLAVRAPSNAIWVISRVSRLGSDPRGEEGEAPPAMRRFTSNGLEPIEPAAWSLAPDPVHALDLVVQLTPEEFFFRLAVLADRHPPPFGGRRLAPALQRLQAMRDLAGAEQQRVIAGALEDGLIVGLDMIRRAVVRQEAASVNHWVRAGATRDLSRARGLSRAAQVWTSLGAPRAADLVQYFCFDDSAGEPLNGGERYELRFPPSRLPPTSAFWELTCTPLPPDNPDDARGASVASDGYPTLDEDGSLRILIQREPPPNAARINWLLPPEGAFGLAMRLHGPNQDALSGRWRIPAVDRLSTFLPRSHRSLGATWDSTTSSGVRRRRSALSEPLRNPQGVDDETSVSDFSAVDWLGPLPGPDDGDLRADKGSGGGGEGL